MVSKFVNLAIFCLAFILSGCANNAPKTDYSAFLQSNPKSILVVMPTNETTEVKGSSAVLTHAILPLSEAGYYVFSPALMHETFKNNGISEGAEIQTVSTQKLRDIFGADSVLYLNVAQYGSSYQIVSSNTTVKVDAKLVDLRNNATLWQKSATAVDDSGGGGGNLVVMLVSALIEQIVSSISDKSYDVASIADAILLGQDCADCLPYGELSPNFRQDKQFK